MLLFKTGDTTMKQKIFLFTLFTLHSAISCAGMNAANGFYLGGDLTITTYEPMSNAALSTWINSVYYYTKVKPYVGYRINDYFALESSYLDLINDHYAGNDVLGPDHYRLYSIDMAGKAIYPFSNGLSFFGKIGLAFVHQNVFNQSYVNEPPRVNSNVNKILPEIGCGISYNFTQHIATDFSLTHIQGNSPIHNIDTLGLGLSYTL